MEKNTFKYMHTGAINHLQKRFGTELFEGNLFPEHLKLAENQLL
jgi:hypothetical protein